MSEREKHLPAEIEMLKNAFVQTLFPIRVYLFGSYAKDTFTSSSDFDFYIVVENDVSDIAAETIKAYRSIRRIKTKPVDILIGTKDRFDNRKEIFSVENEVYQTGVLLYDRTSERMV